MNSYQPHPRRLSGVGPVRPVLNLVIIPSPLRYPQQQPRGLFNCLALTVDHPSSASQASLLRTGSRRSVQRCVGLSYLIRGVLRNTTSFWATTIQEYTHGRTLPHTAIERFMNRSTDSLSRMSRTSDASSNGCYVTGLLWYFRTAHKNTLRAFTKHAT